MAFQISKLDITSRVTSSTLPRHDPKRLCNNENCNKLGLLFCARCKLFKYCGRECQRADWLYHSKECKRLTGTKNDAHLRPSTDDCSKPPNWRPNDRPNVFLDLQITKTPMSIVSTHLSRLLMQHDFRIGYYGASRVAKSVFFLEDAEDCENFIRKVVKPCFASNPSAAAYGDNRKLTSYRAYHDKLPKAERSALKAEFLTEESKIRVLAVAPRTDLAILAPDVEFVGLMVLEDLKPQNQAQKFKAMARTVGMKGHLLMLGPNWMREPRTKEEMEEDKKPPATDEEVGEWRPKSWQTE